MKGRRQREHINWRGKGLEDDVVVLVLVEHVAASRSTASNAVILVHLLTLGLRLGVGDRTVCVGRSSIALLLALHLLEAEELFTVGDVSQRYRVLVGMNLWVGGGVEVGNRRYQPGEGWSCNPHHPLAAPADSIRTGPSRQAPS